MSEKNAVSVVNSKVMNIPVSVTGKDDVPDEIPKSSRWKRRIVAWGKFLKIELWYGKRKVFWLLAVAFRGAGVAPLILVKRSLDGIGVWALIDFFPFLKFLFYLFVGIAMGFLSGPGYLLLHVFEWVRKSEK